MHSPGPIAGGFLGEYAGWRWVQGMVAIFTGVCWMLSSLTYVETYTPVILRRRAIGLANKTGRRYISRLDNKSSPKSLKNEFLVALGRPWVILFKEPIVLLVAIYMGIIYGTLYLCFAAFPIVFQQGRGWSPGVGGLSFLGITVGMLFAITGTIMDNKRYMRIVATSPSGLAPPEARLPPAIVGSILIPTGLFWFAWTNGDNVHWIVPILGSVVFAAGIVLVFLALMNYLIDSCEFYPSS
jgi:MFS family permease